MTNKCKAISTVISTTPIPTWPPSPNKMTTKSKIKPSRKPLGTPHPHIDKITLISSHPKNVKASPNLPCSSIKKNNYMGSSLICAKNTMLLKYKPIKLKKILIDSKPKELNLRNVESKSKHKYRRPDRYHPSHIEIFLHATTLKNSRRHAGIQRLHSSRPTQYEINPKTRYPHNQKAMFRSEHQTDQNKNSAKVTAPKKHQQKTL